MPTPDNKLHKKCMLLYNRLASFYFIFVLVYGVCYFLLVLISGSNLIVDLVLNLVVIVKNNCMYIYVCMYLYSIKFFS